MTPLRTLIALALVACARYDDAALAQAAGAFPSLPRGDASVSVGWFSSRESPASQNEWYRRSWKGSLTTGFYWTEHLKTEVDVGATSSDRIWIAQPGVFPGPYGSATHTFSTRRFSVGQQYQFGHNAWFHPHLIGGVAVEWVRHTEERGAVFEYVSARPPRILEPPRTIGPITEVRARPFVGGGFKAYMSERAFFRSDVRLSIEPRVKDGALTFGFGIDF